MPSRRRAYDHRLRNLVCEEHDPALCARLGVPRSTFLSWLRRGRRDVVTNDEVTSDVLVLQARILQLQRRVDCLLGVCRLLFMLVRLTGARLHEGRLPGGRDKATVLDAIRRATATIPLASALRVVGLSASRFYAWRKLGLACQLDDRASCPKLNPSQLTPEELRTMQQMVTSPDFRHIPVGSLAVLGQRLGRLFASPATWLRAIREHGWTRPRQRVYPAKPKRGLRASRPNEYWHLDVTVIRLLDGTKVYLHAAIDNFSRRILAWKLVPCLDPQTTCAILLEAALNLPTDARADVVTDAGVENINSAVDALLGRGQLRRLLAHVDITFSNSMIEAWWRSLKHHWLYLNQLDSFAAVERLVAFYVAQHNSVIPHSAFHGQTPDEMYSGTGTNIPEQLAEAHRLARQARLAANRATKCEDCRPPTSGPEPVP